MCHQTVSLTARILEAHGIATVIVGAAYDIVTWCGVPRFVYNDLPLGNPLGRPNDRQTQMASVDTAISLIESATEPTIIETDVRWSSDDSWKQAYMKVDSSNRELLAQMGEARRRERRELKEKGLRRI